MTYKAICFYSNIFGKETRKIIPFSMIDAIRKKNTAFLIPALEFVVRGRSKKGTRNVLFTSFLSHNRDSCYKLCIQLHKHYRPDVYSEDPRNAGMLDSPAPTPSRRESHEKSNPMISSPLLSSSSKVSYGGSNSKFPTSSHSNLVADSSTGSVHNRGSPGAVEGNRKLKSSKSIRDTVTSIVTSRRSTPEYTNTDQYPIRSPRQRRDSQGSEFIQFGYFSTSSNDETGPVSLEMHHLDSEMRSKQSQRSLTSPSASIRKSSSAKAAKITVLQSSSSDVYPQNSTNGGSVVVSGGDAGDGSTQNGMIDLVSPSFTGSTAKPTVETVLVGETAGLLSGAGVQNIGDLKEDQGSAATDGNMITGVPSSSDESMEKGGVYVNTGATSNVPPKASFSESMTKGGSNSDEYTGGM